MSPKYKLTYFPTMGLAEPIRFLFAYGGVEYEDYRFDPEEWPEIKKTVPFGKVPTLEVDGKVAHQSVAIARYLANKFNLTGENDWEALECDIMVDTMSDLRTQAVAFFRESDQKKKEELMETFINETMPYYLKRFDQVIEKNNGYFVGAKLTWADLYIISMLDYLANFLKSGVLNDGTYPGLKSLRDNVMSIPSIKSWVERRPKSER